MQWKETTETRRVQRNTEKALKTPLNSVFSVGRIRFWGKQVRRTFSASCLADGLLVLYGGPATPLQSGVRRTCLIRVDGPQSETHPLCVSVVEIDGTA